MRMWVAIQLLMVLDRNDNWEETEKYVALDYNAYAPSHLLVFSRLILPWKDAVGGKLDLFQAKNQALTEWIEVRVACQLAEITVRPP